MSVKMFMRSIFAKNIYIFSFRQFISTLQTTKILDNLRKKLVIFKISGSPVKMIAELNLDNFKTLQGTDGHDISV